MSTIERMVGTVLGGYRLERAIGAGGMGAVFEATQLSLSRRVAVKVMKPAFEHDDARIKRFQIETDAIARLQHPHIVQVIDAGRTDEGTLFLAMELLEGRTVRQLLREGRIPWPRALTIAEGIASALVAAHAAGVIHRDLKAENVIVWDKAGRPDFAKVLDFGVAKLTSQVEAPAVTGTGFVAGTPGYMSPEQIVGRGDDPRADLYSLGVLLFEMLTGRAPFTAQNSMELMLLHLNEPAPRVSTALAGTAVDVPSAVDALVAGLLSKDPALRPPNAQALVDALRTLRESTANTVPDLRTPSVSPSMGPLADADVIGSKVIAAPPEVTPVPRAADAGQAAPSAPAPETSPTVARPLPEAPVQRPRRTRLIAAAVAVLLLGVVITGGFFYSAYSSSVYSTNPKARAHIERAAEAYWELDMQRVLDETRIALDLDPLAAWAHVLRAQVVWLRAEPFALADRELELARKAADERFKRSMMFQITHLQHAVSVLYALDSTEALSRHEAHAEIHRCDDVLEAQMFAVKMLTANQHPDLVEKLFRAVAPSDSELAPATVLGLARVARMRGRLDEARALLEGALKHNKSSLLFHELVDVDLMAGDRAAAAAHLDEIAQRHRDDLRLQLRQAALSGQRDAFVPVLTELRRLKAMDPRRIDGLATVGQQLAALGRLKEADALWAEAFEAAGESSPDLATEIASIATFFSILSDDFARGAAWYERVKEWAPRCESERTQERTRTFALAASFLLSRAHTAKRPTEVDFKVLQGAKRDIPLVMQQIEFSRALWSDKLDEAQAATEALPGCLRSVYRGLVERQRARLAKDPARRREAWQEAAAQLDAGIAPERIAACTASVDVFGQLQAIAVALGMAQRALAAQALEDREGARAAVAAFRAYWPAADEDGVNARDIAAVDAWLSGGPVAGDLTERAAPRKNPRREGP